MWSPGDGSYNRWKNISFVLMYFPYFIAHPRETNFHFFFKCQVFLQRLFIRYIYFLGHDFNKPSPEGPVAINFTQQLLKKRVKSKWSQGKDWVTVPQGYSSALKLISLILHSQARSKENERNSLYPSMDSRFQPLLNTEFCHFLILVGHPLGLQEQKSC